MTCTRGTSNSNSRGSSYSRRRRRQWLVEEFRADVDLRWTDRERLEYLSVPLGEGEPAARCYRCGELLTVDTVTVDRRIPGCLGGKYVQNNIRPACAFDNESTGGKLGAAQRAKKAKR